MIKALIGAIILFTFNQNLNPAHAALFQATDELLLVYGGTGAGKSTSIADKFCLRSVLENNLKFMVMRTTIPALRNTCMAMIQERAKLLGVDYELNQSTKIAKIGRDCEIHYVSCYNQDDADKLESITGLDSIWLEEAIDFRETDYNVAERRLRGGRGAYKQMIMSFNPKNTFRFIYKRFFAGNEPCRKLKYTIHDNPFLIERDPAFLKKLQSYKDKDPNLYKIFYQGDWGDIEGQIYAWDIADTVPDGAKVFYGLDFGFSVDPAALVRVYQKADHYWIEEIIYQTGLTNSALIDRMTAAGVSRSDDIYADSAEPKSIQDIKNAGYNIYPSQKGPDYKRNAIDYLKSLNIHVLAGSENIIKEKQSYVWKKNRDGRSMNVPIDVDDHGMDAVLYAIYNRGKQARPTIDIF